MNLKLFVLILVIATSCSIVEHIESEPTHYIAYEIIACDSSYVYLKNHPTGKVINTDKIQYKPGNYLLLPIQFKER